MMKELQSPPFPYIECLEKHNLDFCDEKKCKWLKSNDNYQTYYCELVFWKLEEKHPYESFKN